MQCKEMNVNKKKQTGMNRNRQKPGLLWSLNLEFVSKKPTQYFFNLQKKTLRLDMENAQNDCSARKTTVRVVGHLAHSSCVADRQAWCAGSFSQGKNAPWGGVSPLWNPRGKWPKTSTSTKERGRMGVNDGFVDILGPQQMAPQRLLRLPDFKRKAWPSGVWGRSGRKEGPTGRTMCLASQRSVRGTVARVVCGGSAGEGETDGGSSGRRRSRASWRRGRTLWAGLCLVAISSPIPIQEDKTGRILVNTQ